MIHLDQVKIFYQEGKYQDAFLLALKLASNGNKEAYLSLGELYLEGLGTKKDEREAFLWFSKSDDLKAIYNTGCCYEMGIGTKVDLPKAVGCYQNAYALDDAKYALALCYYDGVGVLSDVDKAISILIEAKKNGHAPSRLFLGMLYQNGSHVEKDEVKAFELFKSLAEEGFYESYLANCYLTGKGCEKDYQKALEYYLVAAKKKDDEAFYQLGCIYDYGLGVEENKEKANEFYMKAMDNHADAAYNLALSYIYGEGIDKNIDYGCKILLSASKKGSKEAADFLKNFKFVKGKWTPKA